MRIEIFRDKIEMGESQEVFIREKIEHLAKHSERMSDESTFVRVDVVRNKIKTSDKKVVVQITVQVPHGLIRAEDSGVLMEDAFRSACEKLEVQIEKYKSMGERRNKKGDWIESSTLESLLECQDEFSDGGSADFGAQVAKRKKLSGLQVMSEEEAINQMDLLGHDFFIYRNSQDNTLHVVYKRKDDTLGVIEVDEVVS